MNSEHEKQIQALIDVTCVDDTRFLTQKIINYSDYKSEGYQHLENMCVHINKMRLALRDLYAENQRLREALEKIRGTTMDLGPEKTALYMWDTAREALKGGE